VARRAGTLGRALGIVALAGALLGSVLAIPAAGLSATVLARLPEPGVAGPLPDASITPLASVVTDAGGAPIARLYSQYRLPAAAGDIPAVVRDAVVAIEDRRFHDHHGVDWRAVTRAAVENLRRGGNPFVGQGASTITMQYVKNYRQLVEANTRSERTAAVADTVDRKVRDMRQAVWLEERMTKREILTRYLNIVYFGHGAYGIGAAARTFFGVAPAELTLPQAALLAGMISSPGRFDPVAEPRAALDRRDLVLDLMTTTGAVTATEAAGARQGGLGVLDPLREAEDGCVAARTGTGFFCRYLLEYLDRAGLAAEDLRRGGYTITSTLDLRVTDAARRAAVEQVPPEAGIANAVAVVQPGLERHRVLALAANRELGPDAAAGQSAFLLPSAPVPFGAGSIYKIFTAAAAMERGLGIRAELPAPQTYTSRVFGDDGEPYEVSGDSGTGERVTLQEALALSPNTTFVALLDRLGSVDPVVEMAQRLGLRRSLAEPATGGRTVGEAVRAEQRASFTLGPVPTSPLELANVAATLVSDGVWCPPAPVDAVVDRRGQPVAPAEPACEQAVPTGLADTLAVALGEDTTFGTGAEAADAAGWDRPMIGKTGTTQEHLSAGFLGATPQLAAAVMTWSDGSPPRPVCADPPRLCAEGTLFGGTVPAATWFAAMGPVHAGRPVAPLPQPDPDHLHGRLPGTGG
jgi:membrane peptidoglycan carboxypeptidase